LVAESGQTFNYDETHAFQEASMAFVRTTLAAVAIAAVSTLALDAQKVVNSKKGGGGSPHDTVEWTIDGAKITLSYGRPYLKGRPLETLTPAGKIWRTGADEATTMITDKQLMFGSLIVNPGTYTVYTVPGAGTWKLVVNKQTGQWGTEYNEGQDLGRADLKVEKLDKPVEQFTISIDDTPGGGKLRLEWGGVRASTDFMVH
jgi:hypothetical protein